MMMSLKPENRLVMRAAAYSIAVGVPLITAYVWLGVSVNRTWHVMDNHPFVLLLACQIGGTAGFALLGGFVGVIMTIVTKLAHGNFICGVRFRLLVSLIPLLIIALLTAPTSLEKLERFWWQLQLGNSLAKLNAGGWLLAVSAGVGVCQLVAARYEREISPPKNDYSFAFWKAVPLAKMTLTIVVLCVAFAVASDVFFIASLGQRSTSKILDFESLARSAQDGISVGLIFGSAIALTIMLRFSEIRRTNIYRLTMLGVALFVALALWGFQTHSALLDSMRYPDQSWRVMLALSEAGLVCFGVALAADRYRRAATASAQKRGFGQDNLPVCG